MKDGNFFINKEKTNSQKQSNETSRRINDYDYNILREEAYKDVSDELLKLEYKLSKMEKELADIDVQIQSARDISDYDSVEYLAARKRNLQENITELLNIYNERSLSAKISGGLLNGMSPKIKDLFVKFIPFGNIFKDFIISNLPQKVSSVLEVKQSLEKLKNINKNVDELMTMQTPYGEYEDKYVQLSKYITRANAIQSQISKSLRG